LAQKIFFLLFSAFCRRKKILKFFGLAWWSFLGFTMVPRFYMTSKRWKTKEKTEKKIIARPGNRTRDHLKIRFFARMVRTRKLLNQTRFPLQGIPLPSLGAYTVDRKWQKCLEIFQAAPDLLPRLLKFSGFCAHGENKKTTEPKVISF
jgi:hypothetical protein